MTFAKMLHRVLDHYFGDEAFERRDQKQIEKIKERLRPEIYEQEFEVAFAEAWADVPESIRMRLPEDFSGKGSGNESSPRRPATRSIDASDDLNPCWPGGQLLYPEVMGVRRAGRRPPRPGRDDQEGGHSSAPAHRRTFTMSSTRKRRNTGGGGTQVANQGQLTWTPLRDQEKRFDDMPWQSLLGGTQV